MNKLMTLAKKFETKLGLTTEANDLPKTLKKIAKVERKLQKKIAQQQKRINQFSGDVTVKTASGRIPGVYLVCNDCDGRGKVATSNSDITVKLASTGDELPAADIKACAACKGKRVVKVADIRKCSEEQMTERAQYVKDKAVNKAAKKAEKKKKKAAKAIAKAEKKRMVAENPMAYQAAKLKKKAEKKAKKAAKKAMKAVDKAQKAEAKAKTEE